MSGLSHRGPVLHPTDFSEGARAAFPYAVYLSTLFGEELHSLHVTESHARPPTPADFTSPDTVYEAVSRWMERAVGAGSEASSKAVAPVMRSETRTGDEPAREILAYAAEIGAGVICMGTRGRRGVRRLVLGSVAESVIRGFPYPVLTVRQGVTGWGERGLGRILVPVALSPMMKPALAWSGLLAAAAGADVTAVHVVKSPAGAAVSGKREEIFSAYRRLDAPSVRFNVAIMAGDPVRRILEMARRDESDLIVAATHGRSAPLRLVLGSVTEALVRRSSCPVMIVSEPPGPS